MKDERITITSKGLQECIAHKAFKIHETADDLEKCVSKCAAMTDILEEALDSMNEKGTKPSDEATIVNTVRVLQEHITKAKNITRTLEQDLSQFHTNLRNEFSMKEGVTV